MSGKEKILDQLKNNTNNVKTLLWPGDDFSVRGPAKSRYELTVLIATETEFMKAVVSIGQRCIYCIYK